MSAFDWTKLEAFFPGCTHAAIDPHGMLVVMKVEEGVPFFHQSNRWIPGDKGVRKEYGLLGVGGSPDFNAQSTLGANPSRGPEIRAAAEKGTGAAQAPRRPHPGVAASPLHAPTLNEIQNDKSLQTGNINDQPARVDGMPPDRVEKPPQMTQPQAKQVQAAQLNELGLDPDGAVVPVMGYDPAKPGDDFTGHAVISPSGEVVAIGDEAKALAMELAITAQAAAFKSGDQALYDRCKTKVDRLKELLG